MFRNFRDLVPQNGYSIAEILLVFSIIAGVLISVWAMYTILSEETDVKAAVAEILVIREAAVQFKTHDGNGKYNNIRLARFGSYLGDGIAQSHEYAGIMVLINTFGGRVTLTSDTLWGRDGGNLYMTFYSIPNMNVCRKILEHFGEVQAINYSDRLWGSVTGYYIPVGKSFAGYVGGIDHTEAGCRYYSYSRSGGITLVLHID